MWWFCSWVGLCMMWLVGWVVWWVLGCCSWLCLLLLWFSRCLLECLWCCVLVFWLERLWCWELWWVWIFCWWIWRFCVVCVWVFGLVFVFFWDRLIVWGCGICVVGVVVVCWLVYVGWGRRMWDRLVVLIWDWWCWRSCVYMWLVFLWCKGVVGIWWKIVVWMFIWLCIVCGCIVGVGFVCCWLLWWVCLWWWVWVLWCWVGVGMKGGVWYVWWYCVLWWGRIGLVKLCVWVYELCIVGFIGWVWFEFDVLLCVGFVVRLVVWVCGIVWDFFCVLSVYVGGLCVVGSWWSIVLYCWVCCCGVWWCWVCLVWRFFLVVVCVFVCWMVVLWWGLLGIMCICWFVWVLFVILWLIVCVWCVVCWFVYCVVWIGSWWV